MYTGDSQQFTAYRSPPAPPSSEEARPRRRSVDCVDQIRYRSSQNQSRALAYETPCVVQTMGSTPPREHGVVGR